VLNQIEEQGGYIWAIKTGIEAVRNRATIGEIPSVLKDVSGNFADCE
jgi:hypothetical protein